MPAKLFEIVADVPKRLLRIRVGGHWELATVSAYKTELLASVKQMHDAGCEPGEMVALFDAREGGPQSQEVVAHFRDELGGAELVPRRLATLVSSALFKRQVERIAIPNQRVFADEAEALAWLLSPANAT